VIGHVNLNLAGVGGILPILRSIPWLNVQEFLARVRAVDGRDIPYEETFNVVEAILAEMLEEA
jgi:hypothetical protein